MRRTEQQLSEIRFRSKVTVGLILLGAWIGAIIWLHAGLGISALDLPRLIEVAPYIVRDWVAWAVVGCCAALGGWLAWFIFWRGGDGAADADEQGGMSGPRF